MNSLKLARNTLAISLAMTLVVFLTGCSTLLDDANLWTAAAKQKEVVAVATETAEAKQTAAVPDIPPYVANCVRYGLALSKQKQTQDKTAKAAKAPASKNPAVSENKAVGGAAGPSADALVLANLKTEDERRKCAAAVLAWYKTLQEANRKAAAGKAKTS